MKTGVIGWQSVKTRQKEINEMMVKWLKVPADSSVNVFFLPPFYSEQNMIEWLKMWSPGEIEGIMEENPWGKDAVFPVFVKYHDHYEKDGSIRGVCTASSEEVDAKGKVVRPAKRCAYCEKLGKPKQLFMFKLKVLQSVDGRPGLSNGEIVLFGKGSNTLNAFAPFIEDMGKVPFAIHRTGKSLDTVYTLREVKTKDKKVPFDVLEESKNIDFVRYFAPQSYEEQLAKISSKGSGYTSNDVKDRTSFDPKDFEDEEEDNNVIDW